MIELKNTSTTSSSDVIKRSMFQLISVPELSDVIVTLLSSIVLSTPKGSFRVLPLLHSVSDIYA